MELPGIRHMLCVLLTVVMVAAAPFSAYAADNDSTRDVIESADLNPTDPQSEALDMLLDEIMDEILDEDMTTYEQVQTCYDYLVDTMSYGSHMSRIGTMVSDDVSCQQIYRNYGAVEGFGAVALTARVGMCNAYSSAFILMVRKIGLDADLVTGSTRSAGGGYAYHEWAEVDIDGTVYVFDPQLEQNLVSAGLPEYTVFCATYDEIPGRYIKA